MKGKEQIATTIRWIAKASASVSIAFLLYMTAGLFFGSAGLKIEGFKDILTLAFFPTGFLVGLALALKWAGTGGLVTVGSFVALIILKPGQVFEPWIIALASPAILFLICWLLINTQKRTSPAQSKKV